MDNISVTDLRAHLKDTLRLVRDGAIIYITLLDEKIAALVPADIAENYEVIEDEYWKHRAKSSKTGSTRKLDDILSEFVDM